MVLSPIVGSESQPFPSLASSVAASWTASSCGTEPWQPWSHLVKSGESSCILAFGDGSKPWYLVNPKIAGKWMFSMNYHELTFSKTWRIWEASSKRPSPTSTDRVAHPISLAPHHVSLAVLHESHPWHSTVLQRFVPNLWMAHGFDSTGSSPFSLATCAKIIEDPGGALFLPKFSDAMWNSRPNPNHPAEPYWDRPIQRGREFLLPGRLAHLDLLKTKMFLRFHRCPTSSNKSHSFWPFDPWRAVDLKSSAVGICTTGCYLSQDSSHPTAAVATCAKAQWKMSTGVKVGETHHKHSRSKDPKNLKAVIHQDHCSSTFGQKVLRSPLMVSICAIKLQGFGSHQSMHFASLHLLGSLSRWAYL